jgi:hypothetical protein
MLQADSEVPIDWACEVIKDLLLKVNNVPRRDLALTQPEINPTELELDSLLLHVPLYLCPIPTHNQCPVSFCRDFPGREELKDHLREQHTHL